MTEAETKAAKQMVIQSVTAQLRAALDGLDDCSQDEAIDRLELSTKSAAAFLKDYRKSNIR